MITTCTDSNFSQFGCYLKYIKITNNSECIISIGFCPTPAKTMGLENVPWSAIHYHMMKYTPASLLSKA